MNTALNATIVILSLMALLFSFIYSYNLLLFVKANGFLWYTWEIYIIVSTITGVLASIIGISIRNNEINEAVRKRFNRIP